ncbi:FeoB-associated Cys-rich membrane protein [Clostridium sp. LBM24168]
MIVEILITAAIVILAVYIFVHSLHKKSGNSCSCGCNSCKISNKCPSKKHTHGKN